MYIFKFYFILQSFFRYSENSVTKSNKILFNALIQIEAFYFQKTLNDYAFNSLT